MRRRALLAVAAMLVLTVPANGPAGAAPLRLDPPPGSVATLETSDDQDRYALPIGSFAAPEPTAEVAGAVTRSALRIRDGAPAVTAVIGSYRARLAELGFRRLLDCSGEACGGFDFRFNAELMEPPAMRMDVRDFAQLSAGREAPPAYVSVLVSRVAESVFIQIVTVEPGGDRIALIGVPIDGPVEPSVPRSNGGAPPGAANDAAATPAAGGGDAAAPPAAAQGTPAASPEPRAAVTPAGEVTDRRPLVERLLDAGHVRVAGLSFATGGAKLTADLATAIDEMAAMLSANPDLKVAIVGHSDNVGSLDGNIELSRRRAAAVRRALIDRGVAAARLEARGVGYLAPLRSNATEEGRALNRRVELVLR